MSSFMTNDVSRRNFVKLIGAAGILGGSAAMVGCGGNSEAPADGGSSAGTITGEEGFKIGHIGPLTGAAAIYGNATQNGAGIAIAELNQDGPNYQFNSQDDEADPEKSVNAYNTLKDWGMQILVGTTTSGACVAVSAETNADRIFEITPSGSSTEVIGGQEDEEGNVSTPRKDNVFQMCFTDPNQGTASAQYIAEQKLGTKIAIIYKNDDVYSTGIYNKFVAEAESQKLEIVDTETFTEDSKTDFSVQVKAAADAGADLVFLPIYYDAAALILTEAKKQDFAPKFFGCDGMDGILAQEGFDAALAEGLMMLTPFSADAEDEKTQAFVAAYKEAYGEVPNQFAADAYDAVYAVDAAIKKAGVTYDQSAADICDALIAAFTASDFTFDGLTGQGMTWAETGEVSKSPAAVVIENGTYVGM